MNQHTSTRKHVIFCDFDGTITENDNIIEIMKHFKPTGWEKTVEDTIARKLTIKEGVGKLFASLPTSKKEEIVQFTINNARIRKGFGDFLAFCREQDISFYVTSGGIDFFVYPLLAPFQIDHEHIYCNESDFSGETIKIVWPFPCDEHCNNDCGMCKPRIMRQFDPKTYHRIVIGDSVTDFEGAKLADLVYARSHLLTNCQENGIDCVAYENFDEILKHLKGVIEG